MNSPQTPNQGLSLKQENPRIMQDPRTRISATNSMPPILTDIRQHDRNEAARNCLMGESEMAGARECASSVRHYSPRSVEQTLDMPSLLPPSTYRDRGVPQSIHQRRASYPIQDWSNWIVPRQEDGTYNYPPKPRSFSLGTFCESNERVAKGEGFHRYGEGFHRCGEGFHRCGEGLHRCLMHNPLAARDHDSSLWISPNTAKVVPYTCNVLQQMDRFVSVTDQSSMQNHHDKPAMCAGHDNPELENGYACVSENNENIQARAVLRPPSPRGHELQPRSCSIPKPMRPKLKGVLSFLTKLHQILDEPKYHHVISWMPHGRSWRIFNIRDFEKRVLHKHFRSAKYASFLRQVNGWGFRRIPQGPDSNAYFHVCFVRGMSELCEDMRRPPKGENPLKWAEEYQDDTPDFYRISAVAPLPFQTDPVRKEKNHQEVAATDVTTESSVVGDHARGPSSEVLVLGNCDHSSPNKAGSKATILRGESPIPLQAAFSLKVDHLDDDSVLSFWEHDSFEDIPDNSNMEEQGKNLVVSALEVPTGNDEFHSASFFSDIVSDSDVSGGAEKLAASSIRISIDTQSPNHIISPSVSESNDEIPSSASTSQSISDEPHLSKADLGYLAYQHHLLQQQTRKLLAERKLMRHPKRKSN